MEESGDHMLLLDARIFHGLQLFDLGDHIADSEKPLRPRQFGAGIRVFLVGIMRADARVEFHDH